MPVSIFHFTSVLFSGRTLLDRLCMHHGEGSSEVEAKETCHRLLVQGLLHPFSDRTTELQDDSNVSSVFNVRSLTLLLLPHIIQTLTNLALGFFSQYSCIIEVGRWHFNVAMILCFHGWSIVALRIERSTFYTSKVNNCNQAPVSLKLSRLSWILPESADQSHYCSLLQFFIATYSWW